MNDMPVEQSINPPGVYLSQEGKKPLSAADKALEARAVNNLRPEKRTVLPRLRIPKVFVPSVMAAIIACGYGNIERNADATQPPPIPPPAVSESQRPTTTAELVPTTEVPSPPPTIKQQAPTLTPKPPETPTPAVSKAEGIPITELGLTNESKRNRDEIRAIYSQLMDGIEASVPKDERYFVKVGEKGVYQDRALIFTESIEQDGEKIWITMTRDGPKSFSAKDSFFPQLPSDYIETFIKKSADDLRHGPNDFVPYETARLAEKAGKVWFEVSQLMIKGHDGSTQFINFRPDPPPLHMVEEAMVKSQEKAGLSTRPPEQLAREELERAKSLQEVLNPHLNPQQPSQQPPTQPPR